MLPQLDKYAGIAQSAEAWSATPAGRNIVACEQEKLAIMLEDIFGYFALQLGDPHRDILARSPISKCIRVGRSRSCEVQGDLHNLPFESSTVDLVLLAHALEFSQHPEAIMRESFRVLRPEGHLLVMGFNSVGMYGLRSRLDWTGGYPWYGKFIFPSRVKDWFAVLGLMPQYGEYLGYAPPDIGDSEMSWWQNSWEHAGDRWWPLLGGIFILHAIKRLPSMRRLKPKWHEKVNKVGIPANVSKRVRTGE